MAGEKGKWIQEAKNVGKALVIIRAMKEHGLPFSASKLNQLFSVLK